MIKPYYTDNYGTLYCGDSSEILFGLDKNSVDMCVTSPPYWALRDYHAEGQLGQESLFKDYITKLVWYFDGLWDVLKSEGTLWVNIGDTYYGSGKGAGGSGAKSRKQVTNKGSYYLSNKGNKESDLENSKTFKNHELKDRSLCQIPSRFAIAMQDVGWILRNDVIWHKPNQMPSSAKNRFSLDYEHLFFFTKRPSKYYFEQQLEPAKQVSIDRHERKYHGNVDKGVSWEQYHNYVGSEKAKMQIRKGRNKRSVWSINTEPIYGMNHFAKYPTKLIETPIKAGCPEGGVVLDIFFGSGTTGVVCEKLNRKWIGIELNKEYCDEAIERILNERTNRK